MPINIAPPPIHTEEKSVWNTWYIRVKDAINQLGLSFLWTNIDFNDSNIDDIQYRAHNDLTGFQGGTAGQYYHLTSAQSSAISSFSATDWTDLTDGNNTTLHKHRLAGYTVGTLPAGVQGDTAFVTDALAPTYLATVVGGGAVVTAVFYNGTNWVCT